MFARSSHAVRDRAITFDVVGLALWLNARDRKAGPR
jgi:hypothetical protein